MPKLPRRNAAIQKVVKTLQTSKPPRRTGNVEAAMNPRSIMGGSTRLSPRSMKAVALVGGRKSNQNLKSQFTKET